MLVHPVFPGILLHSDTELEAAFRCRVVERKTIHEWPLSCVQSVRLANGTRLIYKAQLPPTVEPLFYESASSKLLPKYWLLDTLGDCQTMAIEWIEAPLLRDMVLSDAELVEHGIRLIAQIGEIGGNLPAYVDIGSAGAWLSTCEIVLARLTVLTRDGRFGQLVEDCVAKVGAWAASGRVLDAIAKGARVIHGDLKAEQVFVTQNGYRVIDWQRPVVAPPEVDLVALLVGQRVNPRRFVDREIVNIFWFLRLRWAVEAQYSLFPESRWQVYDRWAAEAISHILDGSC